MIPTCPTQAPKRLSRAGSVPHPPCPEGGSLQPEMRLETRRQPGEVRGGTWLLFSNIWGPDLNTQAMVSNMGQKNTCKSPSIRDGKEVPLAAVEDKPPARGWVSPQRHQVPAQGTKPEDTAGATGSPARMLGSRLHTLECQAGPEGSEGAQVTIRSVQAPHGVENEEPGGLLDHLVPP